MSLKKIKLVLVCLLLSSLLKAADSTHVRINSGIFLKKMAGFYWLNGVTAEFKHERILHGKINFGISFCTSSLGSAFRSNAIPVHAVELFAQRVFRPGRYLHPYAGLNIGYAYANFRNTEYGNIPNKTALVSIEGGIRYRFKCPLEACAGVGYNLISGNGQKGPGFIYPVYFTGRILYNIR